MKMQKLLRKHHKKFLAVNGIVFVITLIALIHLNEMPGINQITAFSVSSAEQAGVGGLSVLNYVVFSVFILNILSVIVLYKVYNPAAYLIGPKMNVYKSNKAITSDFIRSILKAHSKLTDKEYTMFIMNNLKNNHLARFPYLNFIDMELSPSSNIRVQVSPKIDSIGNNKVKALFQLVLDELTESKSEEEQDSFKTILKYSMEQKLINALIDMGIII